MTRDIDFAEQALIFANADLFEESEPGSGIKVLRDDWNQRYSDAKEKLHACYARKVDAQKAALRIKDEIFYQMLKEVSDEPEETEKTTDLSLLELLDMHYRLQVLGYCYGTPLGSKRPSNIVNTYNGGPYCS